VQEVDAVQGGTVFLLILRKRFEKADQNDPTFMLDCVTHGGLPVFKRQR
jgi:hypothetical protein